MWLNAEDKDLKYLAQRSMISYMRSIFLNQDKGVFDVKSIDTDTLAHSLGLAAAPAIEFMDRATSKAEKKSKLQKLWDKIAAKKAEKWWQREAEAQKDAEMDEYVPPPPEPDSEDDILVPVKRQWEIPDELPPEKLPKKIKFVSQPKPQLVEEDKDDSRNIFEKV